MTLFENGQFKSTSGINLSFKIDCDSLSTEDLRCLAIQCALNFPAYKYTSVPTGGDRFTVQLNKYVKPEDWAVIHKDIHHYIVDDVWTTGKSVIETAIKHDLFSELGKKVRCLVIFARGPYPGWVKPLFTLNSELSIDTNFWNWV